MVHSQGVVFGYGVVVPTSVYEERFPGSFRRKRGTNEWEPINEESLQTDVARVFYSEGDVSNSVFVATRASAEYSFEKGHVDLIYKPVDMQQIINQSHVLSPWLQRAFPDYQANFIIYGYELD